MMNDPRLHILLCEDNEEVIMITEFFLQSRNYKVSVARTTEEIFAFLKNEIPNLLLLDLNLPSEGGEKVLTSMKSDRSTSSIPVIIFSADNKAEEVARSAKADGCLMKPFDLKQLEEIINSATRKQSS